ncbi:MAG TPA: HlyD family efflux transporter periplasmic adaptor subunit [Methylovirgula sp.]|nr:HlyD family efflux transporter periplasmic adaptor subunit [Methylovirgula sp.]
MANSAARNVIRVSSYLVATAVSLVLVTSVVPPIVADETDRAVVDAPAILVTAPVAGDIRSLSVKPGQGIGQGTSIAHLANPRIDRTTLIHLEESTAGTREQLEATRRKHEADLSYISQLDSEIAREKEQFGHQIEDEMTALRAQIEENEDLSRAKQAMVERHAKLVSRGIESPAALKPTAAEHAAAMSKAQSAVAELNGKKAQYEALQHDIYVGLDLQPIQDLAQKRRDVDIDARRVAIEEQEYAADLTSQKQLEAAEQQRVGTLDQSDIVAPSAGEVLALMAPQGSHVSAGDTIATMVNCKKDFVVAIFSYRKGEDLAVGTSVRIKGASFDHGRISAIIPKTSDKDDARFAVPFPQTERRELYAIIDPDPAVPSPYGDLKSVDQRNGPAKACDIGQWVTVSREGGLIPSMSNVWRNVQSTVAILAAAL